MGGKGEMENFNGYPIDYIGDGVYVLFDGNGFELRANDHADPTDIIFLEPAVLEALNSFAGRFLKEVNNND